MTESTKNTRVIPEVIDLDELIPQTRYVRLDKKEHEVVPPSVEMYLQVMKRRQRIKSADTEIDQIEAAIELITLAVPTIPRERLNKLQLQPLTKLSDIIMDMMSDGSEDAATEPGSEETALGE